MQMFKLNITIITHTPKYDKRIALKTPKRSYFAFSKAFYVENFGIC